MRTRQTWRRVVSAAMLTASGALVIATWPSAASADPAVRTGWWNTVSGGGQSAPEPTTLDGGAETTPGQLSLAIVPYMTHDAPGGVGTELPVDSTTPFSVDVAKPDVSSLTVTSAPTTSDVGSGSTTLQQPATNPATSGGG